MRTLFVAWQTPNPSHAWFPIGRLDADVEHHEYVFRYTQGALNAQRSAGFEPLLSFPKFDVKYESSQLFPLFQNRIMGTHRKDFIDYLRWMDIDQANYDPLEILALTGGERQTDSLEVFPRVEKNPDGTFACRFFLHGLRHVSDAGRTRADTLVTGEQLQIALEMNNPATGLAVQLQTGDGHILGWAPRYLVRDLVGAMVQFTNLSARVVRSNPQEAPLARRLLIEMGGVLPPSVVPMTSAEFKPVG